MSAVLERPSRVSGDRNDPYHIGIRYLPRTQPNGSVVYERVALTERDLIFPQEGDKVMNHPEHFNDLIYLMMAFQSRLANRPDTLVTGDCRIDWQIEGLEPLGPDLAVFQNLTKPFVPEGTFRVRDHGAASAFVIEITSKSTRIVDVHRKFDVYAEAGIPLYILIDYRFRKSGMTVKLVAFELTESGYEILDLVQGRQWLPVVNLWLTITENVANCFLEDGTRVPGYNEVLVRAETEKQRAETEKQRAETEKIRAETEAKRADTLAAELAALKAQLAKTTLNGH